MDDNKLVRKMNEHLTGLKGSDGNLMTFMLTSAFISMANNQREVSAAVPDCIPADGQLPSKDAIRSYVLAIYVELGEFLQELDWKPWKNGKDIDLQKVAGEFADILAFMGVLLVQLEHLGLPESVLAEAYRQKSIVNIQRFLGQHDPKYRQVDNGQLPLPLLLEDDRG